MKTNWSDILDAALATARDPYQVLALVHFGSHSFAATRARLGVNVCVSKWVEAETQRSDSHIQISFNSAEGEKT